VNAPAPAKSGTCRECGATVRLVRGFIANHDGPGAIRCTGSRDVSREVSAVRTGLGVVLNYAKTSTAAGVWHRIRPYEEDNPPSYCGLGMMTPQRWVVTADAVPNGELLCMRCDHVTIDMTR
jgi:hypothetical protein